MVVGNGSMLSSNGFKRRMKGLSNPKNYSFKAIAMIFIIMIALYLIIYILQTRIAMSSSQENMDKNPRNDGKYRSVEHMLNDDMTLMYFKMDHCPHCKRFQSVWEEIKLKAGKRYTKMQFIELDIDKDDFARSDENESHRNYFYNKTQKTVPHVALHYKDDYHTFKGGERTTASVMEFIRGRVE
jgi:glutaredoxin